MRPANVENCRHFGPFPVALLASFGVERFRHFKEGV